MAKILYVEDDPMIAAGVAEWFTREGHLIEVATTGEDALQLFSSNQYDLILLDWQLPGMSGIDVCRRYRKSGGSSWIIFLTAQGEIDDKEKGLDVGADDYLVKPFEMRELAARVRSALRRSDPHFQAELRIDDVVLDLAGRTLRINDSSLRLMPKEAALLEFLMRNPNRFFGTKKLLASIWPSESEVSEGTVRTFMRTLRQKLESVGKADFIKTVLGSGYIIESKM